MSVERGSHEEPLRNGPPEERPEIGRALEQARHGRGLSLEQAEEATKIRARYLAAFERENFDVLPAVYARGSLKTYANFLLLDGEAFSRELKRRQEPRDEPQDSAPADHPPEGAGPERPSRVPGVLAGVFAGAGRKETAQGAQGAEGAEGRETREDEDGERSGPIPFLPGSFGGSYLYLGLGTFLALAAIAALLAITLPAALPGSAQTPISQVRQPLASKADLATDVTPLRDEPFRMAGSPAPEGDGDRREDQKGEDQKGDEKKGDEKKKQKNKEPEEESEPVEREKPAVDVAQAPSVELPSQETPTATAPPSTTPPETGESYDAQEPAQEVAEAPLGTTPSTATASAPSSAPSSTPSATASAPSATPSTPSTPSSTPSAPSSTPSAPSSTPSAPPSAASASAQPSTPSPTVSQEPPPAVPGEGPGGFQVGVDVPATRPDGARMSEEIIAEVHAELPVAAGEEGVRVRGQDLPGNLPDGTLPAQDLFR